MTIVDELVANLKIDVAGLPELEAATEALERFTDAADAASVALERLRQSNPMATVTIRSGVEEDHTALFKGSLNSAEG